MACRGKAWLCPLFDLYWPFLSAAAKALHRPAQSPGPACLFSRSQSSAAPRAGGQPLAPTLRPAASAFLNSIIDGIDETSAARRHVYIQDLGCLGRGAEHKFLGFWSAWGPLMFVINRDNLENMRRFFGNIRAPLTISGRRGKRRRWAW